MSENKYTNPKTNPMIRLPDFDLENNEEHEPDDLDDGRIPLPDKDCLFPGEQKAEPATSSSSEPTRGEGQTEPDQLEKDILEHLINMTGGLYEIIVEDGAPTPLFSVIRTADGKLEVETAEGEKKEFSELTKLERKLIQHDLKTRRESWGRQE